MPLVAIANGNTKIVVSDHTDGCDDGNAFTGLATYEVNVTINGLKLVRDGDSTNTHIYAEDSNKNCTLTHTGIVKANQSKVFIEGVPVAVLGDTVTGCGVIGELVEGAQHSVRISV